MKKVKEGEYGQRTLYACMKTEQWNLLNSPVIINILLYLIIYLYANKMFTNTKGEMFYVKLYHALREWIYLLVFPKLSKNNCK
jgi:hypothetical protein